MLKRAASKPPRVFVLKPRALGADAEKSVSCWVEDRPYRGRAEVESARAEVVQARVKRVRTQAGPRAS